MNSNLVSMLFVATTSLIIACSREIDFSSPKEDNIVKISDDNSMSKDELEIWLRERYGVIQPGIAMWASFGEGSEGPFVYKLSDGRTILIEGYATKDNEYFVDPSFDLSTLPDAKL